MIFFFMIQVIIFTVILSEIGTWPIESAYKSTHNLPVTVGGIVGACVFLIIGVVVFIFIFRYIST